MIFIITAYNWETVFSISSLSDSEISLTSSLLIDFCSEGGNLEVFFQVR